MEYKTPNFTALRMLTRVSVCFQGSQLAVVENEPRGPGIPCPFDDRI